LPILLHLLQQVNEQGLKGVVDTVWNGSKQ
jgi:hypothetical protein